jgi:adenylate cyclase
LRIAIGIHYGPIAQSGIGTEKGPGLTVVGETVYIAGQVEAYCGVLDVPLLVTDDFVKALLEEGSLELAKAFGDEGLHELCGCKRPVRLFSLTKQPKANQQQVTSCARHDDIDEGAG